MAAIPQMKEEEVMTDHQFDAMIEMAIQLIKRAGSLDEAIEALNAVKRGREQNEPNSEVPAKKIERGKREQ
jgi:hypothetical protein